MDPAIASFTAIRSQYLASLEMLKQAVVQCPDSLWRDRTYKNRYWHIAFHVLFYTHLYLQPTENDFLPWAKHREEYLSLEPASSDGGSSGPLSEKSLGDAPYSQEDILEYLALCQEEVETQVSVLDPEAESGFYWLPMKKLELQLYNIRHIQQHTGELCERLSEVAGIDVDWVGLIPLP